MKRLLLSLLMICSVVYTNAQTKIPAMVLSRIGFTSATDSTKNYVVLEVPKSDKITLYKKILSYLNSIYKNPAMVLSVVDGESITVNGYTEQVKGSLEWYRYPMKYNINLQFKDGKIKIAPTMIDLKEVWSENKPPRQYYIANDQSPNVGEISCIWMKSTKDNSYWLFQKELKGSIDQWVNGYISNLAAGIDKKEDW